MKEHIPDIERLLISAAVRNPEQFTSIIDAKLTADWFVDYDNRQVWEWVVEHWSQYDSVPSYTALKTAWPTYSLIRTKDPLVFYVDSMRERHRYGILQQGIIEAGEELDDLDTNGALERMASAISQVGIETSRMVDVNVIETWEDRMQHYRSLRDLPGGLRGITTGFHSLDYALGGFQKQQLITFIGTPKAGKSTGLLRMAIAAHEAGSEVLWIGFEMSNEEQQARYDAMVAGVDHRKLLSGRLPVSEMRAMEKELRRRKSMHPFTLSADIASATTVSGIAAKVRQYRPDIVYVDGTYLMDPENDRFDKGSPQALTAITRSMKRMAQVLDIPVVNTTQVLTWKYRRSEGLRQEDIGYASSFAQDSDAVLGVESIPEIDNIKLFSVVIARAAPTIKFRVQWDWETGTFEELDDRGDRIDASYEWGDGDDD